MKYVIRIFVSMLLLTATFFASAAVDSRGKEFMFAFPPNIVNSGNLTLFISSESSATGTVDIAGLGFLESFSINADTVHEISIPKQAQVSVANNIVDRGVHIVSDADITVYALNQYRYTTDAFLVLPVDTLGVEYINVSYDPVYPSQMLVTGVYDNTEVTITPSAPATGHSEDEPFTISLNSGQSYLIEGGQDLTGSIMSSTAPVSVQGAVKCAYIPRRTPACDHIVEMLPPVAALGKSFVTVPLASRKRGDAFRIVASENGTDVFINGVLKGTIDRGEFYEEILTIRSEITTSGPVYLAQYSLGQRYDSVISDPFMMLIPPSEQFLDHYNFSTLTSSVGFPNSFVNVVAPVSALDSMLLDGELVDSTLFLPIGDSGYVGAQIPMEEGSHNIVSSEAFGIYVYGFGSYDSYGYPGGMAFDLINSRGDAYPPGVKLELIGDYIIGYATDSEDSNANQTLDAGEDFNSNGIIDRRSEDTNDNGVIDDGEDLNGNGVLDRDRGIFRIELSEDATNLTLETDAFIPGRINANFVITRIDPAQPAEGTLNITDGAGNITSVPVDFFSKPYLSTVSVVSTFSNNQMELVQDSFNIEPVRIEDFGDYTEVEWQFDQFPADQTETLVYDLIMRNPVPGETRLVLHDLVLSYADVNGNPVVISLGTRAVTVAPSMLNLSTATDKIRYRAGETVKVQTPVQNLGDAEDSAQLNLVVLDSDGVLVTTLAEQPVVVATNSTLLIEDTSFDVGNIATGSYRVRAQLLNGTGDVLRQAEAPFLVVTESDGLIDLDSSVYTQQPTYSPWDKVDITAGLQNMASNSTVGGTIAELKVRAPDGQILLSEQKSLNSISPAAVHRFNFYLQLDNARSGDYQISWKALDEDGQSMTSAMATFRVEADSIKALVGDVRAVDDRIFHTGSTQCQFSINNRSGEDFESLQYATTLLQLDSQVVVNRDEAAAIVGAGEEINWVLDIDAPGRLYGGYSCVLEIKDGDSWQVLASDTFEIQQPLISSAMSSGGRGRVLVLSDAEPLCTGLESIDVALVLDEELAAKQRWKLELSDLSGEVLKETVVSSSKHGRSGYHYDRNHNRGLQLEAQFDDGRIKAHLEDDILKEGYLLTLTVNDRHSGRNKETLEQQWTLATHCGRSFDTESTDDGIQLIDWSEVRDDGSRAGKNQIADVNLEEQNQWLQQLLIDSGWQATQVHTADDFALEHRLGDYSSYVLLSNKVQLSKTVVKELREAVFAGKGLVVANGFGHRNYWLEPALGVSTLGHGTRAASIEVFSSALSEAWSGTFPVETSLNTLRVRDAETLGIFSGEADGGECQSDHDDDRNLGLKIGFSIENGGKNSPADGERMFSSRGYGHGDHHRHQRAAITGYQYGSGNSVLFGFDLLRQAYADGADGQYSSLLNSALLKVNPPESFIQSSPVQPVWVEWENQRGTVDAMSALTIPEGAELVFSGVFNNDEGSLVSRFNIENQQAVNSRIYIRLSDIGGAQTLVLNTTAIDGDQQTEQATVQLELKMAATPDWADTRNLFDELASNYWYHRKYRKILRSFDKAEAFIDKEKFDQAQNTLLKVADDLMKVDESEEASVVTARQQLQRHIQWVGQQLAQ